MIEKNEGWIKLYRKSINHPLFKFPLVWHFWSYCLLKANHKPKTIIFNKTEITIAAGSFITGLHQASSETGLSIRNIRTAKDMLIKLEMIVIDEEKSTNKFTYLTVCNYGKLQKSVDEATSKIQFTDKQNSIYRQAEIDLATSKKSEIGLDLSGVAAEAMYEATSKIIESDKQDLIYRQAKSDLATTTKKTTKEKNKYNIVEEKILFDGNSEEILHCRKLIEAITQKDPKVRFPSKGKIGDEEIKALQSWARIFEMIKRIDERTKDKIEKVLDYIKNPDCWFIILSPTALRTKFSNILIQSERTNRSTKSSSNPFENYQKEIRKEEIIIINPIKGIQNGTGERYH